MFLNLLNEREGKNFLELANIAIKVDGSVDEQELSVMEMYRREMNLVDYAIQDKSLNELISVFQASTKPVKRAIIIELTGILDPIEHDDIDDREDEWVMKLGREWGFRDSEIKKMIRWTLDFNDLLKEGYEYINKR